MSAYAYRGIGQHGADTVALAWRQRTADLNPLSSTCSEHEVTLEQALRSMLALLLAADGDEPDLRLVASAKPSLTGVTVASVRLDPTASILEVSRAWASQTLSLTDSTLSPATLRELITARKLPLFTFGEALPSPEVVSPHCPLAVHARAGEQLELSLASPSGTWTSAVLESLANQLCKMLATFPEQPDASLAGLVEKLPALRFALTLAANGNHKALVSVIAHWEHEIGLPVSVDTVQLGQLEVDSAAQHFPMPRPFGATVIVTCPDEWERNGTRPHAAPLTAPPPDTSLGRLANEAFVAEHNTNETRHLDEEIFIRRTYLRHGIAIPDGSTVIDVGANIGLFALFAHWEAQGVHLHVVEPVAELAELARINTAMYGVDAAIHQVALGSVPGTAELIFYPRSSLQSGIHADEASDEDILRQYAANQVEGTGHFAALLQVADSDVEALLAGRMKHERRRVPVRTLSALIDEAGLERIDLLKVDAERSEQAVLDGITPEHWPRIHQLVLEVHDIDRRVERLRRKLERRGFAVTVEQEPLFASTEIFMLYCTREPNGNARRTSEGRSTIVAAAKRWQQISSVPVHVALLAPASRTPTPEATSAFAAELPGVELLDLSADTLSSEDDSTAAAAVGTAILRHVTAPQRPVIKAIVVDADELLWGGICGEVGPAHVTLAPYRLALQRYLIEQRAGGRMLCLCSRNNPGDVTEVFAAHPEMPLRLQHFAAIRIGWGPKSDGVISIAEELTIATESIVFVDDDPAVRSEIRLRAPHVTVVELPEDPKLYVAALSTTWVLQHASVTPEDRLRASFAEHDAARAAIAQGAPSFEDFLAQLDLAIDVQASTPGDVERISQLARRTNQFNLSLHRHDPADVRRLLAISTLALTVRVQDRFGDYGIVGFVAGHPVDGLMHLSDWFLSCRALGKNVEWAMLQAVGEQTLAQDIPTIGLAAVIGERNAPIHAFLDRVRTRCAAELGASGTRLEVSATAFASLSWRAIDNAPSPSVPVGDPRPAVSGAIQYRWPAPERMTANQLGERLHHLAGSQRRLTTPMVSPSTPTELRVAQVWSKVLGIDAIGVHDDLFSLGGDSLSATAICARIRRSGSMITLESVLDEPTIAGIARRLDARAETKNHGLPFAERGQQDLEATDGQRRLWAAEQAAQLAGMQIIPLAYRIEGRISVKRLEASIEATIDRHRALRTGLVPHDGALLRIASDAPFALAEIQLGDGADEAARHHSEEFFVEPFDLARGPMLRALLLTLAPDRHLLLLAIHHSAADGWSIGIIQRDISAAYATPGCLSAAADADIDQYVRWIQARERSGALHPLRRALSEKLGPGNDCYRPLRSDMPRWVRTAEPQHLRLELPLELVAAVRDLARSRGTTPFAVHLAAFQLVLAVHDERSFVSIGSPLANRDAPGHDALVGFLANIVPIAMQVGWRGDLVGHLDRCSALTREALCHGSVPYGLLLREHHGDVYRFEPPFAAMLTLQPTPSHPLELTGAIVVPADVPRLPLPFELMLDIEERSDGGRTVLRYDGAIFARATALGLIEAHSVVLEALSGLERLPLEVMRKVIATSLSDTGNGLQEAADARRRRIDLLQLQPESTSAEYS